MESNKMYIRKTKKAWDNGSIESKQENVLNENRNTIQGHERQLKDFGLD